MRVLHGTLYFGGDGNLFDQILMNRPLLDRSRTPLKFRAGTAGVFALPDMVSHRASEGPVRFGLPQGNAARNVDTTGYSDHFPVVAIVDEAG